MADNSNIPKKIHVRDLRPYHQLVSNNYIVEKVDNSLKPRQCVETDTRGNPIGQWDDRQYMRIILADSRSSTRMYIYPQLNLVLFLDASSRVVKEDQVLEYYEIREFK